MNHDCAPHCNLSYGKYCQQCKTIADYLIENGVALQQDEKRSCHNDSFYKVEATGSEAKHIIELLQAESRGNNITDLLYRQKAEIKRLNDLNNTQSIMINELNKACKTIKKQAFNEFYKRLKEEESFECDVSLGFGRACYEDCVPIIAAENLLKRMESEVDRST